MMPPFEQLCNLDIKGGRQNSACESPVVNGQSNVSVNIERIQMSLIHFTLSAIHHGGINLFPVLAEKDLVNAKLAREMTVAPTRNSTIFDRWVTTTNGMIYSIHSHSSKQS
jgi:hypothetical protein